MQTSIKILYTNNKIELQMIYENFVNKSTFPFTTQLFRTLKGVIRERHNHNQQCRSYNVNKPSSSCWVRGWVGGENLFIPIINRLPVYKLRVPCWCMVSTVVRATMCGTVCIEHLSLYLLVYLWHHYTSPSNISIRMEWLYSSLGSFRKMLMVADF